MYTAFMELRDRPPAVCTYVAMHDRMNKKGDMLVPGSAKKTAAAKISGEQRTPLLPPILILLDCMTCVAREQERLFFSQGQEHSNNANVKTGGAGGWRTPLFRVILAAAVFSQTPEPTYLYRYLRVLRSVYIESGRPRVGVGGGGAGVSMGKEARKV